MDRLIFLGSGGAFTMNNRQSNMLLQKDNGNCLLIDAGTDIRHSITQAGFAIEDINGVYISHLHDDHAGGLGYIGLASHFFNPGNRPLLFINKYLRTDMWSRIKGNLETLQGKVAELETFFIPNNINSKGLFVWEDIEFQTIQTVHVMDGFNIVPSFGLMFNLNDKRIFITTDCQFCPAQIHDFYNMADLIFHDCEVGYRSGVHPNYDDLKTLTKETKNKMWLYHTDGILPDAKKDGFLGFVKKGQGFE